MAARWWMDLSIWMERVMLTRLVPKRVGPVMQLVFKTPILFYRLGLGGLMAKRIIILVTKGRRSGKQRLTPLEYGFNEQKGAYFLMSGWSGKSDWYMNARACPQVELWVGRKKLAGKAVPATNYEVLVEMERVIRVSPQVMKTLSGYSGVAYDGTPESLRRMVEAFPSVWVYEE